MMNRKAPPALGKISNKTHHTRQLKLWLKPISLVIALGVNLTATGAFAANWVTLPQANDTLLQNLTLPADAPTRGVWSKSMPWPLNAIHQILLPDGRVLSYGTPLGLPANQDGRYFDVWNPQLGFANGSHYSTTVPDPVNSFCGTAAFLMDGRLMLSGGNGGGGRNSGLFTTTTAASVLDNSTLAAERWYASMVTLPDTRQLILGGTVPYGLPKNSQTPEIYQGLGGWRSLFGAYNADAFGHVRANQNNANPYYYPRAWVAPNGKVFGLTSDIMFSLDPNANNGNGATTILGTFKTPQDSSGATTPNVGFTSSAVMYAPGRILQVGGNGITDNNPNLSSNLASIIDINGATPVITETQAMSNRRHWPNATVLPTGKVVVTGGTTIGWDPVNAVHPAEIWDPVTGQWTVGASNVETRTYHSSAILLPNGTVLAAGGGAPGAVNNLNAEVYYPPYLFTSVNGVTQVAARPKMASISSLSYTNGGLLELDMADAVQIKQLALIANSSVTHSFNNSQRYVPLTFTQNGARLSATVPNANLAPPGYYQLVAVNANGVPSSATIVGIGPIAAPPTLSTSNNTALPANAVYCADEGGTCTLPSNITGSIYYGANTQFLVKQNQSGAQACNNAAYGDPIPGVIKNVTTLRMPPHYQRFPQSMRRCYPVAERQTMHQTLT